MHDSRERFPSQMIFANRLSYLPGPLNGCSTIFFSFIFISFARKRVFRLWTCTVVTAYLDRTKLGTAAMYMIDTLSYGLSDDTVNIESVLDRVYVVFRKNGDSHIDSRCVRVIVQKRRREVVRAVKRTVKQTLERYRGSDLLIERSFRHIDRSDDASKNAKRRSGAV